MTEMMISGTVLICMVLILRRLTFRRISMCMRYALWLAVAVRMILPFNIGSSPYSIMSGVGQIRQYYGHMAGMQQAGEDRVYDTEETDRRAADSIAADGKQGMAQDMPETEEGAQTGVSAATGGRDETDMLKDTETEGVTVSFEDEPAPQMQYRLSEETAAGLRMVMAAVWFAGMIGVGVFMLLRQVRFIAYLYRVRDRAAVECLPEVWVQRLSDRGLRVWLVNGLRSPCMAGSGIYLSPDLYEEEEIRLHILAHEYAHAAQLDALWAVVRSVLCIVWWFHPLVWLAAYEAKQDSELACDEQAVVLLGESQRFSYGRTLLGLTGSGHDRSGLFGVVLSMDGSGRRIRQRISVIAEEKNKNKVVTGLVVLVVAVLCGCAYTGVPRAPEGDFAERAGNIDPAGEQTAGSEVEEGYAQQLERAEEIEEESRRAEGQVQDAEARAAQQAQTEQLQKQMEAIAEQKAQLEAEQLQIQRQLEQIEAEWRQAAGREFEQVLSAVGDDALESATFIDRMEYFDYLYNDGTCPMEDGMWYLIHRDERYGIDFYGLYTDKYGSRGVKILIDGDVNTLDIPWRSAVYESGIEVFMIEQTQDGLPRTFAFQMCTALTSEHACWKLYLVDRYDTGTIDFYAFDEADYQKQFQDMVDFRVDSEHSQILLLHEGEAVEGGVDISAYEDVTVEDVFWDGSVVRYYAKRDDENPLIFATHVGVKLAETKEIQYNDLSRIICPIQIGEWGERCFTLGEPSVEQ